MDLDGPPELATLITKVLEAFEGEDDEGTSYLVIPNLLTIEQAKEKDCPVLDHTLAAVHDLMSTVGGQVRDWHLCLSGTELDLECQLVRSSRMNALRPIRTSDCNNREAEVRSKHSGQTP